MINSNEKIISWSSFRLANAKVHIWHASLEQPEEVIQRLEAVLSAEERQRAEEFRYQEHRQSFIVSRGILRNLLSRYTNIEPKYIQFKYTLTGKPFLANGAETQDLTFNLSHAGYLVLYAFAWGRQVGIDVECIRPVEEMDQIAMHILSANEYKKFRRVRPEARLRAFYNCLTRKEAFLKARGDGIYFSPQDVEISFETSLPAALLRISGSIEEAKRWSMHDIKTWDGYAAAVVVEGTITPSRTNSGRIQTSCPGPTSCRNSKLGREHIDESKRHYPSVRQCLSFSPEAPFQFIT